MGWLVCCSAALAGSEVEQIFQRSNFAVCSGFIIMQSLGAIGAALIAPYGRGLHKMVGRGAIARWRRRSNSRTHQLRGLYTLCRHATTRRNWRCADCALRRYALRTYERLVVDTYDPKVAPSRGNRASSGYLPQPKPPLTSP